MHNPTRTITVLLVLAIGGLVALGYGAQRYAKIVGQANRPETTLARHLDGFIEVRRAMRRVVDGWGDRPSDGSALRVARDRGLVMHRVDAAAYAAVRSQYRDWRAGRLVAGSPVFAAFERRREELESLDLGSYERLDS